MATNSRARKKTGRSDDRGLLLERLVGEILEAFFDLRAAGQEEGLVSTSGGGTWGLLRMLREDGPLTVPAVAERRSVSRQYIQKLSNELLASGLIQVVDNPAHKRSKLLRLTTKGEKRLGELNRRFRQAMEVLAVDFEPGELRTATEAIERLRRGLSKVGGSAQSRKTVIRR